MPDAIVNAQNRALKKKKKRKLDSNPRYGPNYLPWKIFH